MGILIVGLFHAGIIGGGVAIVLIVIYQIFKKN